MGERAEVFPANRGYNLDNIRDLKEGTWRNYSFAARKG
jgi:hypothetical protein